MILVLCGVCSAVSRVEKRSVAATYQDPGMYLHALHIFCSVDV